MFFLDSKRASMIGGVGNLKTSCKNKKGVCVWRRETIKAARLAVRYHEHEHLFQLRPDAIEVQMGGIC